MLTNLQDSNINKDLYKESVEKFIHLVKENSINTTIIGISDDFNESLS